MQITEREKKKINWSFWRNTATVSPCARTRERERGERERERERERGRGRGREREGVFVCEEGGGGGGGGMGRWEKVHELERARDVSLFYAPTPPPPPPPPHNPPPPPPHPTVHPCTIPLTNTNLVTCYTICTLPHSQVHPSPAPSPWKFSNLSLIQRNLKPH